MCYKISNIASRSTIEKAFNVSFKYPKLHNKAPVIDGLSESTISIITMENKNEVCLGIWGILPKNYQDDWQYFQSVHNTLNLNLETIKEDDEYYEALLSRRCLILVTGFFTYYLYEGDLYPYYVHLKSNEPFAIAGIYNELDDGFITCSLIVSKANSFIKKIHNSNNSMPVVLDKKSQEKWLDKKTSTKVLEGIIDAETAFEYTAHPIAKEFHKLGVDFTSVLEPVNYNNIPRAI